jgi:hypothetical protein
VFSWGSSEVNSSRCSSYYINTLQNDADCASICAAQGYSNYTISSGGNLTGNICNCCNHSTNWRP